MNEYNLILIVIASLNKDYYISMINNYWIPFINLIKKKISIKIFLLFGNIPINLDIDEDNIIVANLEENYIPNILKNFIRF